MKRTIVLMLVLMTGAAISSQAAQAYIDEGVQGRPHGGHTPQRMLYLRHGLKVPGKYRRHHSH